MGKKYKAQISHMNTFRPCFDWQTLRRSARRRETDPSVSDTNRGCPTGRKSALMPFKRILAYAGALGVLACVVLLGFDSVSAQSVAGTTIQSILNGASPTSTSTSPPVPMQLPATVTPTTQTLTPA